MSETINKIIRTSIEIVGTKEEWDTIRETFNRLKDILDMNKRELYKKVLLWFSKSNNAKAEFIKYIREEKVKIVKEINK